MLAHPEDYTRSCCKLDGTTEGCVNALHISGRKHQYGKLYQAAKLRRREAGSLTGDQGYTATLTGLSAPVSTRISQVPRESLTFDLRAPDLFNKRC